MLWEKYSLCVKGEKNNHWKKNNHAYIYRMTNPLPPPPLLPQTLQGAPVILRYFQHVEMQLSQRVKTFKTFAGWTRTFNSCSRIVWWNFAIRRSVGITISAQTVLFNYFSMCKFFFISVLTFLAFLIKVAPKWKIFRKKYFALSWEEYVNDPTTPTKLLRRFAIISS